MCTTWPFAAPSTTPSERKYYSTIWTSRPATSSVPASPSTRLRILAQTVYYFYAWGRLSGGDPGRKVSFAVPTGNFGDVFAGFLARRNRPSSD